MRVEIIKINGRYVWEAFYLNGASMACGPCTYLTRGNARRGIRRMAAALAANGITLVETKKTLCLMDPKEQP